MKATIILAALTFIWIVTPTISDAKGREHHDRAYEKERPYYGDQQERRYDYDRGRDVRHSKAWKKQQRNKRDGYWKRNHRSKRYVVHRPATKYVVHQPASARVIYREPAVYYPSSYFYLGVPNVSLRFSW